MVLEKETKPTGGRRSGHHSLRHASHRSDGTSIVDKSKFLVSAAAAALSTTCCDTYLVRDRMSSYRGYVEQHLQKKKKGRAERK